MAEQRIAPGPRIAPIPIPQRRVDPMDGVNDLIDAVDGMQERSRQVDQQVAASEARMQDRQRDADNAALSADRGAEFARMQSRITLETEKLRAQGLDGYEDKVRELVDREVRTFDAGFGNNQEVRQRYVPNMADLAARAETGAGLWAMGERAKTGAVQYDGMVKEQGNALTLSPTPKDYAAAMALASTTLDAQKLPPSARDQAWKQTVQSLTGNYIDGLLATGQADQASALLEAGFFNDKVADVDQVRARIGNAREAAAREVELGASRARQDAKDNADLLKAKIDAGIVPTTAEIGAVRAQATAAGLKPDDLFDLALTERQVAINRSYQGKDVMLLLRDRDVLAAKVASGTASEGEQVAMRQLDKLIDTREKETASRYKGLLAQGPQGRAQIVNEIQRLPADARFSQAERVEAGLGYVAGLPTPEARAAALNGRAERKANAKLTPPKEVDATFRATMGKAMIGMNGPALNGVREVAADLYAHAHRAAGGDETFNPGLYRNALNVALGRTRRRDGTPQGGIGAYGDAQVILPDNHSQDEFAAMIARAPFAKATYDGKTAVSKADVLRRYVPVYAGELPDGRTRYRFVDAGGRELRGAGNLPYVLEIR